MKNGLFLVLLALLCIGTSGQAASVDQATAQNVARQFLVKSVANGRMRAAANANLTLKHQALSKLDQKTVDYYVFDVASNGGFIIVSGDDRALPVLAYGDRPFVTENMPANIKAFLAQYEEEMEYLQANPDVTVDLTDNSIRKNTAVSPLVQTTWDQEAPYWNQCPSHSGSTCLTGCVATALAQVMYYWKYPTDAVAGIAAYTTSTYKLSVGALSGTTFDWDNMLTSYSGSYTTAQATAVATLMRYCGQACVMDYGNSSDGGSGAYSEDQLAAAKLFGYNSGASYVEQSNYSTTEWKNLMNNELDNGRPILYGANATEGGGHAFIVDGYNSSGYYHINWGWSGDDDGYFALGSFNGGGYHFNSYNDMLIEVYPPGQSGELETYAPVLADASNVGETSFTASWTDATPSENVTDYTLTVNKKGDYELLLNEDFSQYTTNGSTAITDFSGWNTTTGWTATKIYSAVSGIKFGSSSVAGVLITPSMDLSTSGGKLTVKVNAASYGSDSNVNLTLTCGSNTATQALTSTATDYTIVLDCDAAAAQTLTLTSSKSSKGRFYIYDLQVYSGDASAMTSRTATETGDSNSRVITGITSKSYTVTGLAQGETYTFKVTANYTNGRSAASATKEVTLGGTVVTTPEIVTDYDTYTFTATTSETATRNIGVLGANLTGDVTLTLNDANGVFSLATTTVSAADAMNGATVAVTYAPAAAGTHTATVTLASEGAESVTVTLNGTATDPAVVTEYTFRKVNAVTAGKRYLIVAAQGDSLLAMVPVNPGKTYQYPLTQLVTADADVITLTSDTLAYTLEAATDGYYLKDSHNRYYYQSGTYKTVNATETLSTDYVWTVAAQTDGTFAMSDNGYTLEYNNTYSSYGVYSTATGTKPYLFEEFEQSAGNPDINDDGAWSMADVTTLIAYVLGNNPSPCLTENCDVNGDGNISMADVTTLIAQILGN